MKATDFEFRNRFWIFGGFYWIGFALYNLDRLNIIQFAVDRAIGANGTHANLWLRIGLAFAASLCFLCAALRTWATAYLNADVMQDHALHSEKIVADGPYRHVRNPLYLGGMLLAVGMGLLMSRSGFIFVVIGVAIFSLRLIGLEEANLAKERGASFVEFCRRVPRLLPSLAPRVPASGLQPQWKQAFLGELFMWGFFLAALGFAISLQAKYLIAIIVVALAAYIVRSYWVFRRRKSA